MGPHFGVEGPGIEGVEALQRGGRGDVRVGTPRDAKDMLQEARGNVNRYKSMSALTVAVYALSAFSLKRWCVQLLIVRGPFDIVDGSRIDVVQIWGNRRADIAIRDRNGRNPAG